MNSRTVSQASRANTPRSSRLRKNSGRSILGIGEDRLGVGQLFEDVVDEERRKLTAAHGGARGARLALLAGERHEHLVAALSTANAGEALLPDTAVERPGDRSGSSRHKKW